MRLRRRQLNEKCNASFKLIWFLADPYAFVHHSTRLLRFLFALSLSLKEENHPVHNSAAHKGKQKKYEEKKRRKKNSKRSTNQHQFAKFASLFFAIFLVSYQKKFLLILHFSPHSYNNNSRWNKEREE